MKLTGPKLTINRAKALRSRMSLPEVLLWQVRKQGTGLRFRRQHPAGPYILDFYCDAAKLCVEVDGEQHSHQIVSDERRDSWLADRGIIVLRIAARDVLHDLDGVVRMIAAPSPSVG